MNKKLIRKFKRRHKQVVKKSKFFLRHPLLMPVAVFIVMFCAGLMLLVMAGASTKGASDARIVNLFADGEQRTVHPKPCDMAEPAQVGGRASAGGNRQCFPANAAGGGTT